MTGARIGAEGRPTQSKGQMQHTEVARTVRVDAIAAG